MRRLAGVALLLGSMILPSLHAAAAQTSATIRDDFFDPVPIIVNVGDSVIWTDQGNDPHSVTGDGEGGFDSTDPAKTCALLVGGEGCMSKGDQFTVTFSAAGTYSYHCRVHGSSPTPMVGSVIVQSATTTSSSTTSTSTTLAGTATSQTSTSLASEQPTVTQASLPAISPSSRVALPKSIIREKNKDDLLVWVLVDVAIAGATTIAGIVLVRRGRVPIG